MLLLHRKDLIACLCQSEEADEKMTVCLLSSVNGSSITRSVRKPTLSYCARLTVMLKGLAANLLALLALTHLCFPRARRHTRKFFRLSYYNPDTDRYKLGWDDLPLIFYWIVVFTGLRASMMDYALTPLAQLAGIGKKKARVRFAEQAWIFLYYSAFWSIGMVRTSPSLGSTFANAFAVSDV